MWKINNEGTMTIKDKFGTKSEIRQRLHFPLIFGLMMMIKTPKNKKIAILRLRQIMKYQPKIKEHSIVLIGNFNPKIFQSAWFAAQGLLSQQEAEEAEIEIIHSSVVVFSTTNWMRMEVTDDRFIVKTSQEPYDVVIRDLILGTFY